MTRRQKPSKLFRNQFLEKRVYNSFRRNWGLSCFTINPKNLSRDPFSWVDDSPAMQVVRSTYPGETKKSENIRSNTKFCLLKTKRQENSLLWQWLKKPWIAKCSLGGPWKKSEIQQLIIVRTELWVCESIFFTGILIIFNFA